MAFLSGQSYEPAVDSSGQLKDASEIDFYNSESDIIPLRKKSSMFFSIDYLDIYTLLKPSFAIAPAPRRSTRVTSNNLDVLLDAEKRNSDGEVESKMAQLRKPRKSKSKSKHATQRVHVEEDTDKEDSNFTMDTGSGSESDENSVEEDHDTVDISNVEVRNFYDFVNSLLAG